MRPVPARVTVCLVLSGLLRCVPGCVRLPTTNGRAQVRPVVRDLGGAVPAGVEREVLPKPEQPGQRPPHAVRVLTLAVLRRCGLDAEPAPVVVRGRGSIRRARESDPTLRPSRLVGDIAAPGRRESPGVAPGGSSVPPLKRCVRGDTSPSVSHTSAAATPESREVARYRGSSRERRATRSHSSTACNGGTTHGGRTSVDTSPSMRFSPDTPEHIELPLGSAQTRPSLRRGPRSDHVACGWVGGWVGSAVARSPGGMPHHRWGRKRNCCLHPHRRRPCYARPTDGGTRYGPG